VQNAVATDVRVVKHADALTEAGYDVTVVGVRNPRAPGDVAWLAGKPWRLVLYPRDRRSVRGALNWLVSGARSAGAERLARRFGSGAALAEEALVRSRSALVRIAARQRADLYHANDLNTLPIACRAARRVGAAVLYDAHEFYADVQRDMPPHQRRIAELVEGLYIRAVAGVVTVSPGIADALVARYGIPRPAIVYNAPPLAWMPQAVPRDPARLSVVHHGHIGFGDRGLEDLLSAVPLLGEGVEVHVRGFVSDSVRKSIEQAAALSGRRIVVHPPVSVRELLRAAAHHDVGLVLTQPTCENNRITTPNKVFEYFLAGLAVVITDVPGLRHVVEGRDVGFIYRAGDVAGLAAAINRLAWDPALRRRYQDNARELARTSYNWELELQGVLAMSRRLVARAEPVAAR
jgi:glycosyltransferase involved in cell wall biosynthesis